jgi:hypothetical protein
MRRSALTIGLILQWADHHQRSTGQWPMVTSGRVLAQRGDNWKSVDNALRYGLRGLAGGSSLARLLEEERGVFNRLNAPRLSIAGILQWAVAHQQRTGAWPNMDSGLIGEAPGETWHAVNQALRQGCRGLPGGITLAQLLAKKMGARNHTNIPRLTVKRILAWADAHFHRTGRWPGHISGAIAEAPGESWHAVESALRYGCAASKGDRRSIGCSRNIARLGVPGPPSGLSRSPCPAGAGAVSGWSFHRRSWPGAEPAKWTPTRWPGTAACPIPPRAASCAVRACA